MTGKYVFLFIIYIICVLVNYANVILQLGFQLKFKYLKSIN